MVLMSGEDDGTIFVGVERPISSWAPVTWPNVPYERQRA
jgi:hypothetical protein